MRPIKYRARWKDTGKVIEDFMDEYTLLHLNDDAIMVEQFTGLLDKNGKEIYEGDILRWITYDDYRGVEIENIGNVCFLKMNASFGIQQCPDFDIWKWGDKREVIGNIHENPELLNQ